MTVKFGKIPKIKHFVFLIFYPCLTELYINPLMPNQNISRRISKLNLFSLFSLFPRPYAQQYQVKESSTNKPKPLSDEFSNEFTASGENYGGNNR